VLVIKSFELITKRYSHWAYNENEQYISLGYGKLKTGDAWYEFNRTFSNADTAFLVMDPWADWADENLNGYFGKITEEFTLPLMEAAANNDFPVIIFTGNPENADYNKLITPCLQKLADDGKANKFYHEDYTADSFAEYLKSIGVSKLVYTGYCSNMCVLFRAIGIAHMNDKVQTFFVPKCSGAMEHEGSWETGDAHKYTTLLISQTQALLIEFDDIIKALNN